MVVPETTGVDASDGGSEGALSLLASSSQESGRGAGLDLLEEEEEVGMDFRGGEDRLSLFREESRPGGEGRVNNHVSFSLLNKVDQGEILRVPSALLREDVAVIV